ncbi:unnamed protein product, partial [Staurois parvus]
LFSLAVLPSVARGKVSVPQAVTPSYTYLAALLRDPSITYLVLHCRDVPPAVSPVMSSGDAGICHLGSVPCEHRDVRGMERREI